MPAPPGRSPDARVAYANLIAYSRASTGWCERGSCEEADGILTYAGGSWIPVNCNGAFRIDGSVGAPDLIARADAFFTGRRRGYTIKVRDTGEDADVVAACTTSGLIAFGDPFPEMIRRSPFTDLGPPPPGVDLRPVTDARGLGDFRDVNADAYATYGMPPDVFEDSFDRPGALLDDDGVSIVVAYRGATPVATALTYVSNRSASLQWVGTVADARRSGLGRFITQAATNVAFARGAGACTLQASAMGEPVYAKLGFETLYRYRNYLRWESPGR